MRKYRILQLGLQLGFLVATNTCNSWYYTAFSVNGQVVEVATNTLCCIQYCIYCNSHATICNFFVTNLHVIFSHTFERGK